MGIVATMLYVILLLSSAVSTNYEISEAKFPLIIFYYHQWFGKIGGQFVGTRN